MKVEKFNSLFRKLGEFQLRYKVIYLIAISVITLLCSLGLPKLNLGGNEESWFSDWDTIKISQERFEDLFGANDSVMAFIEADDVVIEEDVWIAANVTLLKGVTVGRGAIVGAGSVCRNSIPPYAIVLGNPAKVIGFKFTPEETIAHEKALYPESERLPIKTIQKNYDRYFINRIKDIKNYLK